jgi:hypothetical protein
MNITTQFGIKNCPTCGGQGYFESKTHDTETGEQHREMTVCLCVYERYERNPLEIIPVFHQIVTELNKPRIQVCWAIQGEPFITAIWGSLSVYQLQQIERELYQNPDAHYRGELETEYFLVWHDGETQFGSEPGDVMIWPGYFELVPVTGQTTHEKGR